jgi:hypothetical protein
VVKYVKLLSGAGSEANVAESTSDDTGNESMSN